MNTTSAYAPPFLSALRSGSTADAPGLWFLSFFRILCFAGAEADSAGAEACANAATAVTVRRIAVRWVLIIFESVSLRNGTNGQLLECVVLMRSRHFRNDDLQSRHSLNEPGNLAVRCLRGLLPHVFAAVSSYGSTRIFTTTRRPSTSTHFGGRSKVAALARTRSQHGLGRIRRLIAKGRAG
jgi:hypothetical protein